MSKIVTLSKFYYGTTVTINNRSIDFSEFGPELRATLKAGSYSATEYAAELQRALREAGSQTYTVIFNRTNQKITITAPSNFILKRASGSRVGTSAWVMMGFGLGSDLSGTNTYTASGIMGSVYRIQYPVSDFIDPNHNLVKENAVVNTTPVGNVQQISFGDGIRITMNMPIITNKLGLKNTPFYENATGIADFMTFIKFCMTKAKVEFMQDVAAPSSFVKCFLEATKQDKEARRFVLQNIGDPEFYESGVLSFRKVLA